MRLVERIGAQPYRNSYVAAVNILRVPSSVFTIKLFDLPSLNPNQFPC